MTALLEILRSRQESGPHFARPLSKDAGTFAYTDPQSQLLEYKDDVKYPRAKYLISAMNQDREGDSMVPEGCVETLEEYRNNAVVLWSHQQDLPAIANAVGPNGEFGVEVTNGKHVTSWAWFHLITPESRDHAKMAKAGVIKAASVGFLPREADRINGGHLFTSWTLTEWSLCNVPMNPKALQLSKALKLERPVDTYRKSWSNGVTLENPKWAPDVNAKPLDVSNFDSISLESIMSDKFVAYGFLKSQYHKGKAINYLRGKSLDASACEELADMYVFAQNGQKRGEKKSLGKGMYGFLAKSAEDEDEKPKEDDKPPTDEKPKDEPEEKTEGAMTEADNDAILKPSAAMALNIMGHNRGVSEYVTAGMGPLEHQEMIQAFTNYHQAMMKADEDLRAACKEHHPDVDFDKLMKAKDEVQDEDTHGEETEKALKTKADDVPGMPTECKRCSAIKAMFEQDQESDGKERDVDESHNSSRPTEPMDEKAIDDEIMKEVLAFKALAV